MTPGKGYCSRAWPNKSYREFSNPRHRSGQIYIVRIKEGSTKIVNCMTRGGGTWTNKSYGENALFLLISSLLQGIDYTNWVHVYSNDYQGRVYQNCTFMTQLMLGRGYIVNIFMYQLQHISIVLGGHNAVFLYHCWFFFWFYDGSVYMQIWTLLTRSQCRVSDTRVTVNACGFLVLNTHQEKRCFNSNEIDNVVSTKLITFENGFTSCHSFKHWITNRK